jgi:lysophospholipase L1-like esterase
MTTLLLMLGVFRQIAAQEIPPAQPTLSDSKIPQTTPEKGGAALRNGSTQAKLQRGEPTTIVCLGDSVTGVYYHTGGQRAYTDMLGLALQRIYPKAKVTMVNAGISGHTTINGQARLDKDVLQHRPDLVTIMFGLNDMTRVPPAQYRENLKTLINRCRAEGSEVLLCTPNNVINTSDRPVDKLEQYCAIIHEVGRELLVPVADCYNGLEALRKQNPEAWRLLLSDEIHPNLDGHKRMAEIIAQSISGQSVTLNDVTPPQPSLAKITVAMKAGRPIKVLAMFPLDSDIHMVLAKRFPNTKLEITRWSVAEKTLPQIEASAKEIVRALKPDLVVIAVPRSAKSASQEEFIRSYSWIMNWSLSFGNSEWECVVVHPSVTDPDHSDTEHDDLIRKLVRAQDLTLVDRKVDDKRPAGELLEEAFPK